VPRRAGSCERRASREGDRQPNAALALDVANASAARGAVREIERGYGRLDVLINNAAIHDDSGVRALDPGWTTIREAFETNLFGAWRVAVACASSPVDTVDS
jgi:NAD(P)-dependent dehydrogenase (short-subunit alcohol dehydrogenase family)